LRQQGRNANRLRPHRGLPQVNEAGDRHRRQCGDGRRAPGKPRQAERHHCCQNEEAAGLREQFKRRGPKPWVEANGARSLAQGADVQRHVKRVPRRDHDCREYSGEQVSRGRGEQSDPPSGVHSPLQRLLGSFGGDGADQCAADVRDDVERRCDSSRKAHLQ